MPARLVDKLASHLDLPRADIERLLADFVAALRDEVRDSGEAAVPRIGTFWQDGDGLYFQADEDLTSAVNFRYDGLLAAEVVQREEAGVEPAPRLQPAQEDAPTPVDVDGDDAVLDEVDLISDVDTTPDKSSDEVWEDAGTIAEEDVPEEDEEDAEDEWLPRVTPPSATPEPVEEPLTAASSANGPGLEASAGEEPAPADPDPREETVAPLPPRETRSAVSGNEPRRRKPAVLWIGAVVVLSLAAVGIYMFGMDRPAEELSPQVETPPPTASDATDVQDTDALDEAPLDDPLAATEAPDAAATDEPIASGPSVEESPLYGDEINTDISQYTLVVASLPSESSANEVAAQWRSRGARTAVFSESTPAGTRFRVGVGQFATIASADSVRSRSDISSDLPEGTWVFRYPASPAN